MYIIVVGCGKVGSNLAKSLSNDNHDVVVIDRDHDNFNQLGSGFNGITISGVPIDEDVLRAAGIEKADALAAMTPDDNMNVVVSQIARDIFKVPKVITRVYDPERDLVFQQIGITTICPTTLTACQVKNALSVEGTQMIHSFGSKDVKFKYSVPDKKHLGKFIKNLQTDSSSMVFGIIKDEEFIFASPNIKIEQGDTLIIAEYV